MSEEPVTTARGLVRVSHHMFYLADEHTLPQLFPRPLNGLIVAEPGVVEIFVGASDGVVAVSVEARRVPPVEVSAMAWDEVAELTMETRAGRAAVASPMDESADLPVPTLAGPGYYRVRAHARGRDTAPDLVAVEPVEEYLLIVWPAPPAPETVYKQTDAYGAGLRRSAAQAPPATAPAAEAVQQPHQRLLEDDLRRAAARARDQRRPPDEG